MLDGHEKDAKIKPERPALDVVEVVLDTLAERSATSPSVDLGPASHAHRYGVPQVVVGHGFLEMLNENRTLRPRPDKAHLSQQDINQLRKFIDARLPQPSPDARATVVVIRGPDRPRHSLGITPHAPKLQHPEQMTTPPNPLLSIENRVTGSCQNRYAHRDEKRGEQKESNDRPEQVERAFGNPITLPRPGR
jgi:hypothetical protein